MNKIIINWHTATETEKVILFAEKVAEFEQCYADSHNRVWGLPRFDGQLGEDYEFVPDYPHNANAVLQHLANHHWEATSIPVSNHTPAYELIEVKILEQWRGGDSPWPFYGCDWGLAPAAMIALLRAKGVEVIT